MGAAPPFAPLLATAQHNVCTFENKIMKKENFDCPFQKKFPSELVKDETYFMTLAYNLAVEAYCGDEVPVGAVIVKNGEVVATSSNQVEGLKDATAHAEMLAITSAAKALNDWRLEGCTLYVTKEPCPMCAGALMLSRIEKVVYAVADPNMGGNGGAIAINKMEKSFHRYESVPYEGELKYECTAMLKAFFEGKR